MCSYCLRRYTNKFGDIRFKYGVNETVDVLNTGHGTMQVLDSSCALYISCLFTIGYVFMPLRGSLPVRVMLSFPAWQTFVLYVSCGK